MVQLWWLNFLTDHSSCSEIRSEIYGQLSEISVCAIRVKKSTTSIRNRQSETKSCRYGGDVHGVSFANLCVVLIMKGSLWRPLSAKILFGVSARCFKFATDSFESRGRSRGAKCHWRNMGLNRFLQCLILLVAVYISSTIGVAADESPGSVLLDQLETEVTVLKDQVEQKYRQKCGFLPTCGGPMNCSRNSCWPLDLGDERNYLSCTIVVSNEYCPSCQSMYFDYTRSYIRLASTTDTTNIDTAAIICSQRELDTAFKSVCNQSSHSRAFLGTVDGTYIQFPGSVYIFTFQTHCIPTHYNLRVTVKYLRGSLTVLPFRMNWGIFLGLMNQNRSLSTPWWSQVLFSDKL